MSDWVVPFLGTDFSNDFEDMVLQYVFDKWDIDDPPKGADLVTNDRDEIKFHPGLYDYKKTYEICAVQTVTNPLQHTMHGRLIQFQTEVRIMIRMKRLAKDGIDDQLGFMEREVNKIARHFRPNDIPGIDKMDVTMFDRVYQEDEWQQSNWRSFVNIAIQYWKQDISDA